MNCIVRVTRRYFPVTDQFHGEKFLVRAEPDPAEQGLIGVRRGALMLTPLALALILVESTDVIFAVDSIPAIFSITADPFLVFTSNVFAILACGVIASIIAGRLERKIAPAEASEGQARQFPEPRRSP